MKQHGKRELNPKRRFPKFRDARGWDERLFSDLYAFGSTNTFSRDNLNYENGTVMNIHYGDIHTRFRALFDISREVVPFVNPTESLDNLDPGSFCTEGDMIFADASEDLEDVGKSIEIVALGGSRVLSGTHTILARRKGAQLIVGFGGHLFRSNRIRSQIRREAQGSKVFGISAGRLSSVKVCFPEDKAEQQKVAQCLTSLDELIDANGLKLDALKAYKKGLMRQLFPREGETIPRLRFPEFRNSPKWEEKNLEKVAQRGSGHTPSKTNPEYYNGGIKWVSLADSKRLDKGLISETEISISEQGIENSSAVLHREGSVLVSRDAGVGKSAIMNSPMAVSQHFIVWNCHSRQLSNWFLYYLLQMMKPLFDRAATGSTIKTIGLQFFKDLRVMVPLLPEQKRIASCLSTLDDLIAAQTQRLETLKTHKKGLMQQLFPSVKEVEA